MEETITKDYLIQNPDHIFVFGDNLDRKGLKGAASLRNEENTYGFITKKHPNSLSSSFYRPEEYEPVFYRELDKLKKIIEDNPTKTFLISKLGAGLANRFNIFEEVIEPKIKRLLFNYSNIKFLWD